MGLLAQGLDSFSPPHKTFACLCDVCLLFSSLAFVALANCWRLMTIKIRLNAVNSRNALAILNRTDLDRSGKRCVVA